MACASMSILGHLRDMTSAQTSVAMLVFSCSEVKKTSFLEFYDFYIRTATKLASFLDGQDMQVSSTSSKGGTWRYVEVRA